MIDLFQIFYQFLSIAPQSLPDRTEKARVDSYSHRIGLFLLFLPNYNIFPNAKKAASEPLLRSKIFTAGNQNFSSTIFKNSLAEFLQENMNVLLCPLSLKCA